MNCIISRHLLSRCIIFSLCFTFFSVALSAGAEEGESNISGAITGKVFLSKDGASIPLEHTEITILTSASSSEPVIIHATTDESGAYTAILDFGVYDICVAPNASLFVQQNTPSCYEQIQLPLEQGATPLEISPFYLEEKYELRLLGDSPLTLEFGTDFYEVDPGVECYDHELQATTSDFVIDMTTDFDATVPSSSYSANYSISPKTYEGISITPIIRSIILKEPTPPVVEKKEEKQKSRVIGSSSSGGGGRYVPLPPTPTPNPIGEVAGAYDEYVTCELLSENPEHVVKDMFEVLKLQLFLAVFGSGQHLPLTRVYDDNTRQAVKVFQQTHRLEILHPLGLTLPTGFPGSRTLAVINEQFCKIVQK